MPEPTAQVRPQRPGELDAVCGVTRAAFGDEAVVELVRVLAARPDTGCSLVAELDGELVGHVALSRGWVDAAPRLVRAEVLSPLSVVPAQQGRGVGGALVRAAVSSAGQRGVPLVFLEGDPGYYRRLGFEPARAHGLTRPSVRIPEPACQVVLLPAWESWMAGALVYPEVFWELDLVGLRGDSLAKAEAATASGPDDGATDPSG